jgi:hypothetical protein
MRSDRALRRGVRLFLVITVLLVVAAGVAYAATPSSSSRAKPPAGWVGQVKYDYTFVETGLETRRASETATVTLRHIKRRGPTFYEAKVGKITWQASGEELDNGCTWSGSGSRAATKYDAFLQLGSSAPYKAYWSSPDDLQIRVVRICGGESREVDQTILHPFFLLFRKTAGVAVDKKLKSIVGSSPGSTTSSSGSETWKYTWRFKAIR